MLRVILIYKEVWDLSGSTGGWHWVGGIAMVSGLCGEKFTGGERARKREGERGRVSQRWQASFYVGGGKDDCGIRRGNQAAERGLARGM